MYMSMHLYTFLVHKNRQKNRPLFVQSDYDFEFQLLYVVFYFFCVRYIIANNIVWF